MQLSRTLDRRSSNSKAQLQTSAEPVAQASSKEAIGEVNAYFAIRDELLAEAEKIATRAKIDSLEIANNFVVTCLKPACHPYEAQSLPENEAARERERCDAVKARIAQLRAHIASSECDRTEPIAR
jgi:hypothetical protein